MNNNNSKGVSYTAGFFLLIGLALLGIFISSMIGLGLLQLYSGHKIVPQDLNNPRNADMLRIIQVVSVVIGMFAPTLATASILNRKPFQLLGYQRSVRPGQIGLVLLIVLAALFGAAAFTNLNKFIPLSHYWKEWSDRLEKQYADQVIIMLSLKSFTGYIGSLILMAFLPALCEETLFRGGLQNFLTRATKIPWLSILIVSIIFSIVHFSFYGFLPRMFLGLVLGYIYYLTNNIWLSIFAHFLNNALAVTQVYILVLLGKDTRQAMEGDLPGSYWGLLAIPLLIYLLKKLRVNSGEAPQSREAQTENYLHGI